MMNMKKALLLFGISAFAAVLSSAEFQIDRFGQFVDLEFPEKVRSEEELKADMAKDKAYYDSFPIPERTFYGSLPGSREKYGLTATGFFHLEKVAALNGRIMLVDPEGNLYFHLGVCSSMPGNEFTPVKGREELYEWLPTADSKFKQARWGNSVSFYLANWIRKHGSYDEVVWQKEIVTRLRHLGFNAFGEFTQVFEGNDKLGFAFTKCLEHYWKKGFALVGNDRHIDPFAPQNAELLEKEFAARTKSFLKNPALIGYYTENEVNYPQVMQRLLENTGNIPAKKKMSEWMKQRYNSKIAQFNKNWETSFADFSAIATTVLKARTPEAKQDLEAFEEFYWDAYFALISKTLKKVDPDHLYLGERILPHLIRYDRVIRAMGKHCDIFSANYYTNGYLPKEVAHMAAVSTKPVMLSEWSFGSPEQGLFGVRNVKNQQERAAQYRRYVENAAATPGVVGVQWFCLLDESNTGRGWSSFYEERFNTGLFNICDRPYKVLTDAAAQANNKVYDLIERKLRPVAAPPYKILYAGDRVVKVGKVRNALPLNGDEKKYAAFSKEPLYVSLLTQEHTKKGWGEFRFGWDEKFFYCHVYMPDNSPAKPQKRRPIDGDDSIEIFLGANPAIPGRMQPGDRQLLIRADVGKTPEFAWRNYGRPVKSNTRPLSFCKTVERNNKKGFVMEVAIPWEEIGFDPASGKKIAFDLIVNAGHGGCLSERLVYNGIAENELRRDIWATGILAE